MNPPRPIYETDDNISAEKATALECAEAWDADCQKLKKLYPLDFVFIRDNVICGFAEIKCRTCERKKYPTYMLGLDKLIKARVFARFANVPCLLIVKWTDNIGFIDVNTPQDFLSIGGRTDRDDELDIEPVAHWSISLFRLVKRKRNDR